jgi:hypothetical protein
MRSLKMNEPDDLFDRPSAPDLDFLARFVWI